MAVSPRGCIVRNDDHTWSHAVNERAQTVELLDRSAKRLEDRNSLICAPGASNLCVDAASKVWAAS